MRQLPFLLLICLLVTVNLFAQDNDCEQTLNTATAEFEAGRFFNLPALLKPCLDKGFSTEQRVRAYLLLTQAYLVLDDHASAEKSYLQLLRANPEFIANPVRDPIDVYYLSKKFTSTPIFTPSFRLGLNTSLPRTIYNVNTSSVQDKFSTTNTFKVGYQIGGGVDWNVTENWSLCAGFGYARKVFKTTLHDGYSEWQGTFVEKQDWFDIPLYIKYTIDSGKIRPFAYAGVSVNLLLNAKLSAEGVDNNFPAQGTQKASTAPDYTITSMRNFLNRSLVFGGGAKYKVGKNFFFVDLRYIAGLNNIAKNTGYNPLMEQFHYQTNFFRFDNLSISVGYIKPLYDPRKKGRVVAGMLEKLGIKRNRK